MRRLPALAVAVGGLCAVLLTTACDPAQIEAAARSAAAAKAETAARQKAPTSGVADPRAASTVSTPPTVPTSLSTPPTVPLTAAPGGDVPSVGAAPSTPAPTTTVTTPSGAPVPTRQPTTVPPAPVRSDAGVLWTGDAETGNLSQFQSGPWNDVGGTKPSVVTSPVRAGKYAFKVGINGATTSADGICCGSRDELLPSFRDLKEGDDLYFGFSTYLAPGFVTDADWQVITQFKQNFDGSPPLSLNVEQNQYMIEGGYGHPGGSRLFIKPISAATTGTWVDWVLHVKFSANPAVGYVEAWQNGKMVLPRFAPPGGTLYPGTGATSGSYVKTGPYRDPTVTTPETMYLDEWRIGATREAVVPR